MITVLDMAGEPHVRQGEADMVHFLNARRVGARRVQGMAHRLTGAGLVGPLVERAAHQPFYVTAGQPLALYGGQRHALAPGRGVSCGPGEPCSFENLSGPPAAFYRFVVPA